MSMPYGGLNGGSTDSGQLGNAESNTLNYENGTFKLGGMIPAIIFSDSKITIGCKHATATAMDELCRLWTDFRMENRRKVIQSSRY